MNTDFLCPDKASYKAVRTIVTNKTLGPVVNQELHYIRDIRSDRYAIRTAISIENIKIELEFISFDNYALKAQTPSPFNVRCIDEHLAEHLADHLADQLLLSMVLARAGSYTTTKPSFLLNYWLWRVGFSS